MYLYHFGMQKLPFGLTPDTDFFCPTSTHIEALNLLNFSINTGEGLIKLIGEVGTGKTLLCRLLLNQLEKQRFVAYIPYPKLTAKELKFALAKELNLRISSNTREDQLSYRIQQRLLTINQKQGPVILLIDEAHLLDDDGLETLRLFSNLETEQNKLLQIILFAQPELNKKLAKPNLRQIQQRIAFNYQLTSLNYQQIYHYVEQRLNQLSYKKIKLSLTANYLIKHYSRGVPRLINILCHKALLLGYSQNKKTITCFNLIKAAKDTESVNTWFQDNLVLFFSIFAILTSSSLMAMAFWRVA